MASESKNWNKAMDAEVGEIEKKNTWDLVPRKKDKKIIGTKWVYKNKFNKESQVERNKERLVCNGHAQIEGIDFEETFALVARIDAIRIFLEIACYINVNVNKMDFKSNLLNGELEVEVDREQLEGFQFSDDENQVCRSKKALYGLNHVTRT